MNEIAAKIIADAINNLADAIREFANAEYGDTDGNEGENLEGTMD